MCVHSVILFPVRLRAYSTLTLVEYAYISDKPNSRITLATTDAKGLLKSTHMQYAYRFNLAKQVGLTAWSKCRLSHLEAVGSISGHRNL